MHDTKKLIMAALLLAFACSAYAEDYLFLMYAPQTNEFNISVIEDTLYYQPHFFRGAIPDDSSYEVVFNNNLHEEIFRAQFYVGENNFFPLDMNTSEVILLRSRAELFRREISFCNNNGVCEPCLGNSCRLYENYVTCRDCSSGSADGFCDLRRDSICDADCEGFDADCEDCIYSSCIYFDDQPGYITCEGLDGVVCEAGQFCSGNFMYADDVGSRCCAGECRNSTAEQDKVIVEYHKELKLEEEKPISTRNLAPLVILAVLVVIALVLIYLKKRHLLSISFIFLALAGGYLTLQWGSGRNLITGRLTLTNGELLKTSVTKYFTPYEDDFTSWCCGPVEDTDGDGRLSGIDYCRVSESERTFYEEVKCQGSGVSKEGDKLYRYSTIATTKADSPSIALGDNNFNGITACSNTDICCQNPTPKRTLACPSEIPFGTEFYFDYGSTNPWTGCYVCDDRGGAIVITGDQTIRFDLYVGRGRDALNKARSEASTAPKVYVGCSLDPKPCATEAGEPAESQCGSKVIEIAERGLDHPYCFRPKDWFMEPNPPLYGSCPGHDGSVYCSVQEYNSLAQSTGKCPIDCSTYIKWVVNTYIKENLQQDYQNNDLAISGYPASLDLAKNYGTTVDGNPERGDYNPPGNYHYDIHFDKLQAGDLIFFSKKYASWAMGHVAMYMGDGNIIHARGSGSRVDVVIDDLQGYVQELEDAGEGIYVGAKRFCPTETGTEPPEEFPEGVPAEVLSSDSYGYYYLNPSFRVDVDFSLEQVDQIREDAEELVMSCSSRSDLQECILGGLAEAWHIGTCNNTELLIPQLDIISRTVRFCVETGRSTYIYDAASDQYFLKPLDLLFALYFEPPLPEYLGNYTGCTCGDGCGDTWDGPMEDDGNLCDGFSYFLPREGGRCCNRHYEELQPDTCPGSENC